MTRTQVGEIQMEYEIRGDSGDWVLFVMGLGYGRWGWTRQVDHFAKDFRVITFDNRGVGGSDAPEGPYSAKLMAADAVGLLDALGVERAHVVGSSLGGFISLEIAIGYPDRVDRLVLVSTGLGGPDFVPMPEVTLRLIAEAPSLPDDERLRRFISNGFTEEFVAAHPEVIEEFMTFRRETAQPLTAWQAQAAAGATFDASERAGQIKAETLVVTGLQDNVVDARNSALTAAAIPRARLAEMPGGHLVIIEEAERFNRVVSGFLKSGGAEEPTANSAQTSRRQP